MVLDWMVNATVAALHRYEHVVIGHLFSALPTLGLGEADVSPDLVDSLAIAAANPTLELRWPSAESVPRHVLCGHFCDAVSHCC